MADTFAEFAMPDTDLTRAAYDLAFTAEQRALAHHSVRVYLFGRALGEARGLRPGDAYDDELLFVACLLHDMGLTDEGDGDQRFEVDGADVAAGFLEGQGVAPDRVRVVWEAIALHTSVGIPQRMRPEIALTSAGAGLDVAGLHADRLPEGYADRVHAAYPRLEKGSGLTHLVVDQIVRKPAKAPFGSLPYEIARQSGVDLKVPSWAEQLERAWSGVA
ncbi:HD domain-containing protein [Actinomadura litoris]|uniref:HD domain-containing protein n=1 Tax=Actinomadura litoris TaxID=2678616 RepID=UPI001FA735D0|nr:HD domain-containing protein [Actinomadura litoris]